MIAFIRSHKARSPGGPRGVIQGRPPADQAAKKTYRTLQRSVAGTVVVLHLLHEHEQTRVLCSWSMMAKRQGCRRISSVLIRHVRCSVTAAMGKIATAATPSIHSFRSSMMTHGKYSPGGCHLMIAIVIRRNNHDESINQRQTKEK